MVPGLETAGKALEGFRTPNPHLILEVQVCSSNQV